LVAIWCQPPNQTFKPKGSEGDDVEDYIATATAAETDGGSEVADYKSTDCCAADDGYREDDLPEFAEVKGMQAVEVVWAFDKKFAGGFVVPEPVPAILGDEAFFDSG
jgi:hypothetical protein